MRYIDFLKEKNERSVFFHEHFRLLIKIYSKSLNYFKRNETNINSFNHDQLDLDLDKGDWR
jgi:hypothetical protein